MAVFSLCLITLLGASNSSYGMTRLAFVRRRVCASPDPAVRLADRHPRRTHPHDRDDLHAQPAQRPDHVRPYSLAGLADRTVGSANTYEISAFLCSPRRAASNGPASWPKRRRTARFPRPASRRSREASAAAARASSCPSSLADRAATTSTTLSRVRNSDRVGLTRQARSPSTSSCRCTCGSSSGA